ASGSPLAELSSIGPRIASPVDQQILPGDETGVLGAQKGAIGAELRWPSVAPCRIGLRTRAPDLLEAPAARGQHRVNVRALRATVEYPRQEIVDGDIAGDRLPREAGNEAHEAGACAVRQTELPLGNLHAARDDVDDPAEAAGHHAVHGEPHHLDG